MDIQFTGEQEKIFEFVQSQTGHGIIDAVAGAGKTTTIMECARFVKDKRTILFCAFNKSIAKEIKDKFNQKGMTEVNVHTVHSLGLKMLNAIPNREFVLVEDKYEKLLNSSEIQERLKPCYDKLLEINGIDPLAIVDRKQQFAMRRLERQINGRLLEANQKFRATLTTEDLSSFEALVIHFGIFTDIDIKKKDFKEELQTYFEAHNALLDAGNKFSDATGKIDYTDMLYLPNKWSLQPVPKYEFIFIDECQDLSKSQFEIALKYRAKNGRILAVGDPCQSIYGFTGADIASFQRVKDSTNATQFPLTTCFRCPQKAIDIAKETRPDIVGVKTDEGSIIELHSNDVVGTSKAGDLIVSRLKAPLLLLVFDFIDKNIKVQIHSEGVKEIISELKEIFKPNELSINFKSSNITFDEVRNDVLHRWHGIIRREADRIIDEKTRNLHIEARTLYLEEKLDFLQIKIELWNDDCLNLTDILKKIKEYISAADGSVKLSTIHSAKGLENDRVFILHYDELPYCYVGQKEWERTQEMNLKYVAVTRVKYELFLVSSKSQEEIEDEESLFHNIPVDL